MKRRIGEPLASGPPGPLASNLLNGGRRYVRARIDGEVKTSPTEDPIFDALWTYALAVRDAKNGVTGDLAAATHALLTTVPTTDYVPGILPFDNPVPNPNILGTVGGFGLPYQHFGAQLTHWLSNEINVEDDLQPALAFMQAAVQGPSHYVYVFDELLDEIVENGAHTVIRNTSKYFCDFTNRKSGKLPVSINGIYHAITKALALGDSYEELSPLMELLPLEKQSGCHYFLEDFWPTLYNKAPARAYACRNVRAITEAAWIVAHRAALKPGSSAYCSDGPIIGDVLTAMFGVECNHLHQQLAAWYEILGRINHPQYIIKTRLAAAAAATYCLRYDTTNVGLVLHELELLQSSLPESDIKHCIMSAAAYEVAYHLLRLGIPDAELVLRSAQFCMSHDRSAICLILARKGELLHLMPKLLFSQSCINGTAIIAAMARVAALEGHIAKICNVQQWLTAEDREAFGIDVAAVSTAIADAITLAAPLQHLVQRLTGKIICN